MIRLGKKKPHLPNRYHSLAVTLTSTDRAIIEWLQEHFGGTCNPNGRTHENQKIKSAWKWQLLSRHAEMFLRAVRPYLLIKAPQADVGLALRATAGRGRATPVTAELITYRESLKQEMHRLNRRGTDPADTADQK